MDRPASVTVFGILNILFGVFGIFSSVLGLIAISAAGGNPFGQDSPVMDAWLKYGTVAGFVVTILLIIAGIGLLLLRSWGRILSIIYAVYAIISTVVGTVLTIVFWLLPAFQQMEGQGGAEQTAIIGGMIGGVIGTSIGCIYPALLWYFMKRPHVLAAFAGTWLGPDSNNEIVAEVIPPLESGPDSGNPYEAPRTISTSHGTTTGTETVIETLIPSKNGPALASYYLGLFSLLPLLGFPLAVAAVYLGMKGLKKVRENPAVRGGVHAWIGLICGVLFGLFNLLLLAAVVIGIILAVVGR